MTAGERQPLTERAKFVSDSWASVRAADEAAAAGSLSALSHYRTVRAVMADALAWISNHGSSPAAEAETCRTVNWSSRVCELGTKCCVVVHGAASGVSDTREGDPSLPAGTIEFRQDGEVIGTIVNADAASPVPAVADDPEPLYAAFHSTPDYHGRGPTFQGVYRTRDAAIHALYPDRADFRAAFRETKRGREWEGPDGFGIVRVVEVEVGGGPGSRDTKEPGQ